MELFGYERAERSPAPIRAKPASSSRLTAGYRVPRSIEVTCLRTFVGELLRCCRMEFERLAQDAAYRLRVVAATNQDLARHRAGALREGLHYRLNVVPIDIPPQVSKAGRHPGYFKLSTFAEKGPESGFEVAGLRDGEAGGLHGRKCAGTGKRIERSLVMPANRRLFSQPSMWQRARAHGDFSLPGNT